MARRLRSTTATRWLPPALLLTLAGSWLAFGQTPAVRQVQLSAEPLHAGTGGHRPTLTLALSVEYPTVGAQYLDPVYDATDAYIGHFDTESCYAYVDDADASLRRFDRFGAATASVRRPPTAAAAPASAATS